MSLENAVEFMLYTNFGIDFKDGNIDTILNVAIDKAYKDATMQGAYNALKKKNADSVDINKIKDNFKNEIKELLGEGEGKDIDYNNWHDRICNYLIGEKAFKNVILTNDNQQAFTYGNAQKWINMTMKYLYILSEIFHKYKSCCDFDKHYDKIQYLYKYFQVPVDSYIIEAVWNEKNVKLPIATVKDFRNDVYKESRAKCWSIWNDENYINFNKTINNAFDNGECPLDWEHKEWIKIAKQRKKEKQKNK